MKSLAILIPTYNESFTIVDQLKKLEIFKKSSQDEISVLVIDDNSPDGTADLVDNLQLSWVKVLRRPNKAGLGAAYRAGFAMVLADSSYTHIVTMDADGSHRVEDLPLLIAAIRPGKSITLGTRWMPGGRVLNWPKGRQWLSKTGTKYAKLALKIDLNDLTGGYRIYSTELLNALNLKTMQATGYCFQIEMAMAADLAGAVATEVPITFVERINGVSKMTKSIVIEALIQITRWGVVRRLRPNADK
ncbi:MAG: polyprenol monophosphomannose synthase [Actinobacteria bacterium]|nr:polyprenol monophosphomannose synthase [Actinomycetota bacterium]